MRDKYLMNAQFVKKDLNQVNITYPEEVIFKYTLNLGDKNNAIQNVKYYRHYSFTSCVVWKACT